MKVLLTLLSNQSVAQLLTLQTITVRIHSQLALNYGASIKLWYLARAFNLSGSGLSYLSLDFCSEVLDRKPSTIYQYLREGKAAGLFRAWRVRRGIVRIFYSSLHKITLKQNLTSWGDSADLTLTQLTQLRYHATGIAVQCEQRRSHYAARMALNKRERQFHKLPLPEDLLRLNREPSLEPRRGKIRFHLATSRKRIFVATGFVPFGTSQPAIADIVERSLSTVQRHLVRSDLQWKQLIQNRPEYIVIMPRMHYQQNANVSEFSYVPCDQVGSGYLYEPNGLTSARKEDGHKVTCGRFFLWQGKAWMYRTNIYNEPYLIRTCRRSRNLYKKLMTRNAASFASIDKETLLNESKKAVFGGGVE